MVHVQAKIVTIHVLMMLMVGRVLSPSCLFPSLESAVLSILSLLFLSHTSQREDCWPLPVCRPVLTSSSFPLCAAQLPSSGSVLDDAYLARCILYTSFLNHRGRSRISQPRVAGRSTAGIALATQSALGVNNGNLFGLGTTDVSYLQHAFCSHIACGPWRPLSAVWCKTRLSTMQCSEKPSMVRIQVSSSSHGLLAALSNLELLPHP
jgi:hypothetical protein